MPFGPSTLALGRPGSTSAGTEGVWLKLVWEFLARLHPLVKLSAREVVLAPD